MQLQLPLFPHSTKMVSECLGVYEQDALVQYIINGLPAYAHLPDDLNEFRYITSNFIARGLCRKSEVQRAFHVSIDSVHRSYDKYLKEGRAGFFGNDGRKGYAHKLTGKRQERVQRKLDKGQSVLSIAKEEGVSEGAIRYAVSQGYLKKKIAPQ
jgi:DNA-binding NarL/FixJ family response regulator